MPGVFWTPSNITIFSIFNFTKASTMPGLLICTDLDRTLIPNGSQAESPGAREAFAALVANPDVTLAYVSGRHRELVQEAIQSYALPMPDWVVGDVGTTIYRVQNDDWQHWQAWEQDIASAWRGLTANDLQAFFNDLPLLRLQEQSKQNRFKLSYYLAVEADTEALIAEMQARLNAQNLKASLIYSIDEAAETGLLDVLPAAATKLHAVEFLMKQLGFCITDTLFAGDSGNDLPVIVSPLQSVLVANADHQVVEQANKQVERQGTESAFYLAGGGFLGMNGNYSAGILEGVAHYFPERRTWLESHCATTL